MKITKKTKKGTKAGGEKVIKISVQTAIYGFLIMFIFLIGTGSVLAYGTNTQIGAKIAAKISNVVPFPAAIVKWNEIVYLKQLEANMDSVELFYKTQKFNEGLRVDFTTEIGQKRLEIKRREILDKMVEDQVIKMLATQKGIEIDNSQVDLAVNNQLNAYGTTDEVKSDLLNSYGWSIDDFKERVVLANMYAQALSEKVLSEQKDAAIAKDKIEKAQAELNSGSDFAQVVEKYSEGSSKEAKGELGWVKKDQVIKELSEAIFDKQDLKKNEIVESSIGFHIVQIEEKKKEGDNDVVKLRQIFVSKNTFAEWLQNEKKKLNIWIPMRGFVWDKSSGAVKFRDEEMNKFENEQRLKAEGDVSLMF